MIDWIANLVQTLLRWAVIALGVLLILMLLSGRCIAGVCLPQIDLQGITRSVVGQPAAGKPACPEFQAAFPQLLPDEWQVEYVRSLNIDTDAEEECLVIYRYDRRADGSGGLLGGVIYDLQTPPEVQAMPTRAPFRPLSYVPYLLLPRENGRGFLGERPGNWSAMIQVYDANGDGGDELVVLGYSGYSFPTYLTIFKWQDRRHGYRILTTPNASDPVGGPIWGDRGIQIVPEGQKTGGGGTTPGRIVQVVAKQRAASPIWYFRSRLCFARQYAWDKATGRLQPSDYYLTFCFGRPAAAQPAQESYAVWYPEEALLAWYDDGQVREIRLPLHVMAPRLEATVILRDGTQHRWIVTRESIAKTEQVRRGPRWHLQRIQ